MGLGALKVECELSLRKWFMSPSTEVKKKKKAGTPNKKKKSHTHFLYYQNQVVILIMTLHPTALCLFLISNIHLKVGLVIIFKRRCQLCMLRFGFVISGCHSLIKCSFPSSQIYLLLSAANITPPFGINTPSCFCFLLIVLAAWEYTCLKILSMKKENPIIRCMP